MPGAFPCASFPPVKPFASSDLIRLATRADAETPRGFELSPVIVEVRQTASWALFPLIITTSGWKGAMLGVAEFMVMERFGVLSPTYVPLRIWASLRPGAAATATTKKIGTQP